MYIDRTNDGWPQWMDGWLFNLIKLNMFVQEFKKKRQQQLKLNFAQQKRTKIIFT